MFFCIPAVKPSEFIERTHGRESTFFCSEEDDMKVSYMLLCNFALSADFIRDQSSLVHLLHALIADYYKYKKNTVDYRSFESI